MPASRSHALQSFGKRPKVKDLTKLFQLTYRERVVLLRAFIALAICRAGLYACSFEKLQHWANRPGCGRNSVARLTWAIEVASKKMPGATCLCRALALQRLLSRNGHESELRIGVEKNDNQFGAHAWLVSDGQVVIGGLQLEKYELLPAWRTTTDKNRQKGPAPT